MTTSSSALVRALVSAWTSDATVAALIGDRVLDAVPTTVAFPYVWLGNLQEEPDEADGFVWAVEIWQTVHVFSRAPGKVEARTIADALKRARPADGTIESGWRLVSLTSRLSSVSLEPDGLTTEALIIVRASLEPTEE